MSESPPSTIARTNATEPDSLTLTITDALAEARGVDPIDLPPLNDYVDIDALSRLVDHTTTRQQAVFCRVTLQIGDEEVQVYDNGKVEVRPYEADAHVGATEGGITGDSATDRV